MRIVAAVPLIACMLVCPSGAAAHARFRLTSRILAPQSDAVLEGAGLRARSRVPLELVVGTRRVALPTARASRSGRLHVVVRYTPAVRSAAARSVGAVAATLVVHRRRLRLRVLGTVLDHISLTVVPAGPVGDDDALTLRADRLATSGPPVSIRFRDCEGGTHAVAVARPTTARQVRVVLQAHVAPRTAIDTTCFTDLALEYAAIDFTIGETVGTAFHPISTATASFLPPLGA